MAKAKGKAKPLNKTEIRTQISEITGLTKKEVASVFDALTEIVGESLGKRGAKVFSLPGLVKFKVVHKKAKKARKGVNPFTGEEMMFKAKPASNVVKAQPLKALKEMV